MTLDEAIAAVEATLEFTHVHVDRKQARRTRRRTSSFSTPAAAGVRRRTCLCWRAFGPQSQWRGNEADGVPRTRAG